jgi:predicted RNA methylase
MDDTRQLGQFIPIQYHYNMLLDQNRMQGFKKAIEYAVKPEMTVLELGGGTGVLSFFAAQIAKKIYCVELNLDLVEEARRLLKLNSNGDRVEVIHEDAFNYLPPEPVDAVICEMLHVGLLREKQMEIINSFKRRYVRKFDKSLPIFIPTATIQAIQPVQNDFNFEGYYAPVVQFQDPYSTHDRMKGLGDPVIYHQLVYHQPYELRCKWKGEIAVSDGGNLNALRIITKNILAIDSETNIIFDWHNQYLLHPLEKEIPVKPNQKFDVSIDYPAGAPLTAFKPILNLV